MGGTRAARVEFGVTSVAQAVGMHGTRNPAPTHNPPLPPIACKSLTETAPPLPKTPEKFSDLAIASAARTSDRSTIVAVEH